MPTILSHSGFKSLFYINGELNRDANFTIESNAYQDGFGQGGWLNYSNYMTYQLVDASSKNMAWRYGDKCNVVIYLLTNPIVKYFGDFTVRRVSFNWNEPQCTLDLNQESPFTRQTLEDMKMKVKKIEPQSKYQITLNQKELDLLIKFLNRAPSSTGVDEYLSMRQKLIAAR